MTQTLNAWIDGLNAYMLNRVTMNPVHYHWKPLDYTEGTAQLLTIYKEYLEYTQSETVTYERLLELFNKNKSKFYEPWLSYFVSFGIGQWTDIWNDIKILYHS